MRTFLATAWLLLALRPAFADDAIPCGQLIDPVVSLRDPAQCYALYLPSAYDARRSWPILYCFDPAARGAMPAALFREAAERYGWIVAASNNSRNGPWKEIVLAARAIWDDTHARLRIDDGRVYAAGFSGGARVASGLGRILEFQAAGVIACGGGLPEWLEPADIAATPWFGTAGHKDFNLREMRDLEKSLRRQGTPCLLKEFKGRHSWPPADLALGAVAWLEELRPRRTAADPWQGGEGDMTVFTMGEGGESAIHVPQGQVFAIRFTASPGTGYNWALATEPDERLLEFLGETAAESKSGLVGGRETFVWTFWALAPGATEISMKYSRPWEKDIAPIKRYVFQVTIEP